MKNTIGKRAHGHARSRDARVVRIRSEHNGIGALKTLIIALLLLAQIALLFLLYLFFIAGFRHYLLVSFILSLLTCIYVVSSDKNSQSKAVWIIFLLLTFSFGYIIYFLSDEKIFFGKAKKKYRAIFDKSEALVKGDALSEETVSQTMRNYAAYLENAGPFPAFSGTEMHYFPSGGQLFDAVLPRLAAAEHFIFMEFFIISDGVLLERVREVLEERARAGVDVRILYDDMGSYRTLSRKTRKAMRKAGIRIYGFNRLLARFSVAMNYRDHRKIIVVDGKIAYTGGSNLADEYVNEKRMFGYWKDTGFSLEGPAVDSFTRIFLRQWAFVSKKEEDMTPFFGHSGRRDNPAVVIPYADGLDYERPIGKEVYTHLIADAKKRLWIMTPYFIPDQTIAELLAEKAMAGVDVRLILPEIPDKRYVYTVTRGNAERLIDSGVKVYCLKNAFVHAKLMLNENTAVVGSINIDLRSFYQQFECAILTDDREICAEVEKDFNATFPDCFEITAENRRRNHLLNRVHVGLMRLLAPLM